MAHKTEKWEELCFDKKRKMFYCQVTAYWKDKSQVIMKKYENGDTYLSNNINFWSAAGWLVSFEGEISNTYYGGKNIVPKNVLKKCNCKCNFWARSKNNINWAQLSDEHPEFKYLFRKMHINGPISLILKLINAYRNHPEIEPLVEAEQYKIAADKRLMKMSLSKRKEIINVIKDIQAPMLDLSIILYCNKHKIKYNDYEAYRECGGDLRLVNLLSAQKVSFRFYRDYVKTAKEMKHNVDDEYWKYPKSVAELHDRVMEEKKAVEEAKNLERKRLLEDSAKALRKTAIRTATTINGYKIFIPTNLDQVKFAADKLKQCLITAGYDKKMFLDYESLLVFIWQDDNKPLATAEITWDKKIAQFYADESDRYNCKPTPELYTVLNTWLADAKLIKPRKRGTYGKIIATA